MKLEKLLEEVMAAHILRKDRCESLPLQRIWGKKHRARPNTALITLAAQKSIESKS